MRKAPRVLAVVGAQYGSEGKGAVIKQLAHKFGIHVRVGGPNAGHSFYHLGKVWKMRGVPCGWINPEATIVIGAGAIIDPEVLVREIAEIKEADPSITDRLMIDQRAWCVVPSDKTIEESNGLGAKIGSTLEGVGCARMRRMSRMPDQDTSLGSQLSKWPTLRQLVHPDTAGFIQENLAFSKVLLEGTQGLGLSLIHGPWPYATSADTSPAQMAADIGIPAHLVKPLLVFRTFPIRVAGNSGPLKNEITWDALSKRLGRTVTESTTVTKRTRRVGEWDPNLMVEAVKRTGARLAVMTFADYIDGSIQGAVRKHHPAMDGVVGDMILEIEERFGLKIVMVGTGGDQFNFIHRIPLSTWLGEE